MSNFFSSLLTNIEKGMEEEAVIIEKLMGIGTIVSRDINTIGKQIIATFVAVDEAFAAKGISIPADIAAWNDLKVVIAQFQAVLAGKPAPPAANG